MRLSHVLFITLSFAFCAASSALPESFEVKTFAKPPDATYPTGLSVSPQGDAYVSVDLNSSLDRKPDRGSIIRASDRDGDGVADHYTKFVPHIDSPRGSCFVGDTLYVVNPPFLTAFRDTDNDGVADQRTNLIEGMGFDLSFRGADHTSNGVRMGIDGWLYLAIGDYGMLKAVARDGSTMHLHGGGVLRVRPDGSELEAYAVMTRNICDVAVSPTLDIFSRDNTNDGKGWNTRFHHYLSLANLGYPRLYKNFPDEHFKSLADYGGGSGTGGYYLDEPGIPEAYNDKAYTCDFTTRNVYVHPMTQSGATFTTEQEVFFKKKAIDMDVDGRSRIYVCDWEGGGYKYSKPDVGSISIITPKGYTAPAFPNLKKNSGQDLLRGLVSKSAVLRINAQHEILRRGKNPALSQALAKAAGSTQVSLYGRIACIFTLKQLDGADANPTLTQLIEHADIREWAIRALTDRSQQMNGVSAQILTTGLSDSNKRVVAQSIIGLARLGDAKQAKGLLPIAAGDDHALAHVARKALVKLNASAPCLSAIQHDTLRPGALAALQEMHTPEVVTGLISALETTNESAVKSAILTALFRLYQQDKPWDGKRWWGTRPDDRGPYFEPIVWSETERIRSTIKKQFETLPTDQHGLLFLEMRRNRIDPASLEIDGAADEVLALIEFPHPPASAIAPLAKAAKSKERTTEVRIQALQAIARIPGTEAFNAQLDIVTGWKDATEPAFQAALTDFVYSPENLNRPKIMRDALKKPKGPKAEILYRIALNVLSSPLASDNLKETLQKSLKGAEKNPAYKTAFAASTIKTSPSSDKKIMELPPEDVLQTAMNTKGDIALGGQLFMRQGCIACHTISQDQPQKGPYLGAVGGKFDRKYLIEAIINPSLVVAQGFQSRWFKRKDGTTVQGFVTGDVDTILEVRNVVGIVTMIPRAEIVEEGSYDQSMMPPGLAGPLTTHEFSSLIDYLQSLKQH